MVSEVSISLARGPGRRVVAEAIRSASGVLGAEVVYELHVRVLDATRRGSMVDEYQ